ncbi:MAG: ATP-binding protein [SAR324 cluster bacterium]|nr:ATP-binding protein [SAR324 cluster bacterium]
MKLKIYLFLLIFLICSGAEAIADEPQNNLLDISQSDWPQESIPLTGPWKFIPNVSTLEQIAQERAETKPVTFPHLWSDHNLPRQGFGAYILTIRLPKNSEHTMLRITEINSAYKIYVDADLIAEHGVFSTSFSDAKPDYRIQYVEISPSHKSTITLTLFVSNYSHFFGGVRRAPTLGSFQQIQSSRFKHLVANIFLFSGIAFIGFYHFSLFWIRPKEVYTLFFAATCLLVALKTFLTGEQAYSFLFPNLDQNFYYSLRVFCAALVIPVPISFARLLFIPQLPKLFEKTYYWIGFGMILGTIILPPHLATFGISVSHGAILLGLPFFLYYINKVRGEKAYGFHVFLITIMVMLATLVNDILFFRGFIHTSYFMPWGFFIFFLSQSLILGTMSTKAVKSSEELSKEKALLVAKLNDVNQYLEARIRERTAELQESEARYRQLVDLSPLAILATIDGKIIFCNDAAAKLAEAESTADLYGKEISIFLPPDEKPQVIEQIIDLFKNNKTSHVLEQKIQTLAGNRIFVEVNSAPIQSHNTQALLTVIRNISEQKTHEETLKSAKLVAEDALKSKSEFLATMSHELRTPLNGVIAMAFYLQETPLNQDQKESVDIISNSAENLHSIINDILDFSKLEANKVKLNIDNFQLDNFLSECTSHFNMSASKKGLKLILSQNIDNPIWLQTDQQKLRQVLDNLLSNAIKFTLKGSVTISALIPEPGSNYITFSVKDTGIGIEEEKLSFIFQPFEQVDRSATRAFEGTGLGLTICQHFVALLGGAIKLESEPLVGSNFSFTIPFQLGEKPEKQNPAPASLIPNLKGKKILIVEDNSVNSEILIKLLTKAKADYELAFNGREAIQKLCLENFDCVLMDIQMPVLDGYEATAIIRQRREQVLDPQIKIIAITANALESDRAKCLAAGMDDYISKPFKTAALYKSLENILEHSN